MFRHRTMKYLAGKHLSFVVLKIALLAHCFALSFAANAADTVHRPNIVLIISDYMGYHDTEPYGAEDVRTPSLAQLAAEGVTMTDFYAATDADLRSGAVISVCAGA